MSGPDESGRSTPPDSTDATAVDPTAGPAPAEEPADAASVAGEKPAAGPTHAAAVTGSVTDEPPAGPADAASGAGEEPPAGPMDAARVADEAAVEVEEDFEMARLARERDDYLDALRRLQADFENYKKRMIRQQTDHLARAAESIVEKLLPVFDTADLAIAHGGGEEVKQVWTALFETMEREGLERIDPLNVAFDPTVHDAVAHVPGDGAGEPEVIEVMRAGYRWKGRVLRPAMVKVRG
jgi:molecular chaperone GrpE